MIMKKLILFTLLFVLSLAGFSQNFGRLKIHSGLYDNFVINGPDTVMFGWRTDRFQFRNSVNVRFIDLIKSDSTVIIYNKLILESPNDTMLSVRGNAKVDTLFYSAISPEINTFDSTHIWTNLSINKITARTPSLTLNTSYIALGNWGFLDSVNGNYKIGSKWGVLGALTGKRNICLGNNTLWYETTGSDNVAIGEQAMFYSDKNNACIAIGSLAMQSIGSAINNIGIGKNCGISLSTGSYNVLLGALSGQDLTTGSNNIRIGYYSGADYVRLGGNTSNSIYIGRYSGAYQELSDRFIINQYFQGSRLKDSVDSYMYGVMNATSSAQMLRLNSNVYVKHDFNALGNIVAPALKDTVEQILLLDTFGVIYALPYDTTLAGKKYNTLVLDDGILAFDAGVSGWGTISAIDSGIEDEFATFRFDSDGTVRLTYNTTNVGTTAGVDNSLNIYDNGSNVIVENKLGGTRRLKIELTY
jgi:hypothetical protein